MARILTFLFILCTSFLFSQVGFEIVLESENDMSATDFIRTPDNDYIGLVHKCSVTDSACFYTSYLYKVTNEGDTMGIYLGKQDTICTYSRIYSLTKNTKGYLLVGFGYRINHNPHKPFIIIRRIDIDLNILWEKTFSFLNYNYYQKSICAIETQDGKILTACTPESANEMFILELTSQGDSIRTSTYSGDNAGNVMFFTYSPDSSQIWLHTRWAHYQPNGSTCSIISLNNNLEQVDVYYYPKWYRYPFYSICYPENQLLTTGDDNLYFPDKINIHNYIGVYLLDSVCDENYCTWLTDKDTLSRPAEIKGIDYYYPGCIYVVGNHNYYLDIIGHAPNWIYIARLNDTLGLEYEQYIGGDNIYNYWPYSVVASVDGGVFITGTRQLINAPYQQRDVFFLKIDSTGYITDNTGDDAISLKEALIYPNPGINELNIRTGHKNSKFYLFNNSGQLILHKKLTHNINKIDVNHLTEGLYHYYIIKENITICNGSWIKSKN